MDLLKKYPELRDCLYSEKQVWAIRVCYRSAYEKGIAIYRKDVYQYTILNPFAIAEHRAALWMGCKHIGKKPTDRLTYKDIKEITRYLNGEG